MAKTVKKFYLDEEIFDILVNEKFDDNGKSIEKKEEKDKETVEVTKLMLKNRKRLNAFSQYIYEYTSAKNFYLSYYRILFEYLTTKKYNEGYRKQINDIQIEITKALEDKSDDTNVFMSFLKTFQTIQKIVLFLNGISSYIRDKTQTNENDNLKNINLQDSKIVSTGVLVLNDISLQVKNLSPVLFQSIEDYITNGVVGFFSGLFGFDFNKEAVVKKLVDGMTDAATRKFVTFVGKTAMGQLVGRKAASLLGRIAGEKFIKSMSSRVAMTMVFGAGASSATGGFSFAASAIASAIMIVVDAITFYFEMDRLINNYLDEAREGLGNYLDELETNMMKNINTFTTSRKDILTYGKALQKVTNTVRMNGDVLSINRLLRNNKTDEDRASRLLSALYLSFSSIDESYKTVFKKEELDNVLKASIEKNAIKIKNTDEISLRTNLVQISDEKENESEIVIDSVSKYNLLGGYDKNIKYGFSDYTFYSDNVFTSKVQKALDDVSSARINNAKSRKKKIEALKMFNEKIINILKNGRGRSQ